MLDVHRTNNSSSSLPVEPTCSLLARAPDRSHGSPCPRVKVSRSASLRSVSSALPANTKRDRAMYQQNNLLPCVYSRVYQALLSLVPYTTRFLTPSLSVSSSNSRFAVPSLLANHHQCRQAGWYDRLTCGGYAEWPCFPERLRSRAGKIQQISGNYQRRNSNEH